MLERSIEALRIFEQSGTCLEKGNAVLKVARAYYYLRQFEPALRNMLRTRATGVECNIDSLVWKGARLAGAIYFETSRTDSALIYLHEAEKLLSTGKDDGELSSTYSLLADCYYHGIHDKQKGHYYAGLAEQYAIKSGNKNSMAFASIKKGAYATEEGDCKTGLACFRKAYDLYTEVNSLEGVMFAMHNIARASSECGDAKETYRIYFALRQMRDSIFKAETAGKTALFRTMYETERKEKENALLAKDNALAKLQIANEVKNRKLLLAVFIVSFIALIIIFFFAYSRYRLKKKAELEQKLASEQELRFKQVLEAEENERQRIAADLHDGVGQMMSAAKLNMAAIESEMPFTTQEQKAAYEKVMALVDESCREVRAVSHNMMPNALLKSGLASAIRTFINQIDSRIIKIDLYTEGLNERIDPSLETVLYRVVQECVNNVIKHSGANHLDISIIKDDDGISATIEDNGNGFDATDKTKFEGIGLKNITSRISYLKGTVEWDSAPGKGTVVAIHIP